MPSLRAKSGVPSGIGFAPDLVKSLCHDCSNHTRCTFAEAVAQAPDDPSSRIMRLRLRHGYALFHEGTPLIGSYVVCSGLVVQYASKSGASVFCVHGKGASPDLVDNLMGATVHRSSAVAIGEAVVAFLPERDAQARSEAFGQNMVNLLRQTARQAWILEERLMHRQAVRSYERVAELFRGMIEASEPGLPPEGAFSVPMDRPLFAKLTGMAPETFSRAITGLQKAGLLVQSEGVLKFPMPDQLCRLTREGL